MQQHSSATYKHPQSYLFVFQLHSGRPAVIWITFCTPMCPASLFRNACPNRNQMLSRLELVLTRTMLLQKMRDMKRDNMPIVG